MARSTRLTKLLRSHSGGLALVAVVGAAGVSGLSRLDTPAEAPPETALEPVVVEAPTPEPLAPVWDLPNLDHARVDYWVDRFQNVPAMREKFEGFLVRSGWYSDMISEKLAERGMPQDLFYLAMIESGFQARAYSPAAASGIWQFIAETGKRYGLRVDGWVDERNHPDKATDAALDYLEDLHHRFDSWYLAAAAYNTGENRVGRIMREEFGTEKAYGEGAYYRIWDRLPRETRDYVPLMIAAGRIAKEPVRYGFDHVQPNSPLDFDEVVTDAQMTLAQVARAAGVAEAEVELLNPWFKKGRLPGDRRVVVRLPAGTAGDFHRSWASVTAEDGVRLASVQPSTEPATYRVRSGDNLTVIARRHGLSVGELRQLNGMRGSRIYAGQTLRVASR